MKRIIAVILVSFLFSATASAVTYYVDATLGNDTHDGLSEVNAWQTIAKVNASAYLPGDSILFKCGETWRETLEIPNSGTTNNPITFGSYPAVCPDANNKPLITASQPVTGWTQYNGNIYVATAAFGKQPLNLITNGGLDFELSPWGFTVPLNSGGSLVRDPLDSNDSAGSGSLKFTSGVNAGDHHLGSSAFSVEEGKTYQVSFKIRADAGKTVGKVIARMAGSPWTWACSFQQITADDTWRTYASNYCTPDDGDSVANEQLNAGFYVYLYPDYLNQGQVTVYVDDISVMQTTPYPASIQQVFVDGQYIKRAHHPNKGYLLAKPDSVFLNVAENSDTNSNYLYAGDDLNLEPGQDIVGAGIHIRTVAWRIEDRLVTAYNSGSNPKTIALSDKTEFSIRKGWGYYLDNKLWMLDEPGEWYYDPDYQKLYVWLPDGLLNGNNPNVHTIEVSVRDQALYASSRTDIVVDGLKLKNAVKNGIEFNKPMNFTFRNLEILNSGDNGISVNGDGLPNSTATRRIENSSISNSVRQGIQLQRMTNVTVTNNSVVDSGTVGNPVNSRAAITAGDKANNLQITNNTVARSGYIGINYGKDSLIQNNVVEQSCLVLSDCGAIYTYNGGALYYNPDGTPTGVPIPVINSQVLNNIVSDVIGGTDGSPGQNSAAGIYLDGYTNGVEVTGNTVINTSNSVHANSPFNNAISNNTFFGSRGSEIDFSNYGSTNVSSSAVHDNAINNNLVFSLSSEPVYHFWASYDSTAQFCTADNNSYSSMYTTTFFRENLLNGTVAANNFTYSQWQQTTLRDQNSTLSDSFGIAPVRVTSYSGNNLLLNPNFDNGLTSWSCSSDVYSCLSLSSSCASGGNCLRYTVPVTSYFDFRQNVNIQAGVDYVLRFDIRAGKENAPVVVGVIWPPYTGTFTKHISVGTTWESYHFIFKAPSTQSALMLVQAINASVGDTLEMDNFRLEPVTLEQNDPADDAKIIINKSDAQSSFTCADSGSDPARCNEYVRFPDAAPVVWPITLAAKTSAIVVWSANPMKDTDRDSIADNQDICAATPVGVPTDDRGCSFAQQHPADLTLSQLSASTTGTNLLINDSVKNLGYAAADTFDISYYFSTDATYQAGMDAFLCKRSVANLVGGDSSPPSGTTQTICPIPNASAGTYYVIAIADSGNAITEGNETNNATAAPVTISGKDLLPMAMSASRSGSNKVLVTETVKNQGNQSVGSFTIRYYLSTNTTYEPGTDIALASSSNGTGACNRNRGSLGARASSSISGKTCYKPTGASNGMDYYVLVVDDAQNQVIEYNEGNNVRATVGTMRW